MRLLGAHFDDMALADRVQVVLFRDLDGVPRGWFIAPLVKDELGFVLPFLPIDANVLAGIAVIRAIEVAETHGLLVDVFDPEKVWKEVWS